MPARLTRWILGLVGAVVLALLLLFYTPPGLTLAGRLADPLTGGRVRIEELGGFFPNHLNAAHVEIADARGKWLQAEQASLDWSALEMLRGHLAIDQLSVAKITVLRRPVSSRSSGGETLRTDIASLSAPRIVLAPPVIGHAVSLSARGSLHYASIHRMAANLVIARPDNGDSYRIAGNVTDDVAHGMLAFREGVDGILGRLVDLPGLGPVNLSVIASGDAGANIVAFQLSAGLLNSSGHGTVSLKARRLNLDAALSAPAMTPSPEISWEGLSGRAHVDGSFDAPDMDAHLLVTKGAYQGVASGTLALDLTGGKGRANLAGRADHIMLPGRHSDLLAHDPLRITAEIDLKDKTRPVRFSLSHPLAHLSGIAQTAGPPSVTADLFLPSLVPYSALAGFAAHGDADFHLLLKKDNALTQISLDGRLNTKGGEIAARLLGNATLAMTATLDGADLDASHIRLRGTAINAELEGSLRQKSLNARFAFDLLDLSRLAGAVQGSLVLQGTANGPAGNAAVSAGGHAILATRGFARQRVNLMLKADGLPKLSNALLSLDGRLDDAPLRVHASLSGGKARRVELNARWRSFDAQANLGISVGNGPSGNANLTLNRLADITAFSGMALSGAAKSRIIFNAQGGKTGATISAELTGLHSNMATLQRAALNGHVSDLLGKPQFNLNLDLQKIEAQGWSGTAQAKVLGPADRLGVTLLSHLAAPDKSPLQADATASLDLSASEVVLTGLKGSWHGLMLELDTPALLHFAHGLALDHLAAHLGKGSIAASGQITPQLSLNASAAAISLADFRGFVPQLGAAGTVSAHADLHGSIAAPRGRIELHAQGLRTAFSGGMPPGVIHLTAQLMGDSAVLQADADAGANAHLLLTGTAPFKPNGAMTLHAGGKVDMALLDAVAAVSGQSLRGTLTLNGDVHGSPANPRITGHAELAGGEFQDYSEGIRVHDITATLVSDGARLSLTQFRGQAGTGTISARGHVDLLATGMPVDLQMDAADARPISNDLMSADLSGNVTLQGHLKSGLALAGNIQVAAGNLHLPESFPPQVAILNVRHRGQPPPPAPAKPSRIALDLALHTTGPVFVRGHGVDAEMHGDIELHGTIGAPFISGGLTMDRGTYSIVGQTLDFTTGRINFDGRGLRSRLDPALDFTAQSVSGGITATLTVTGYASAPKIVLSSTPQLPQDEVIAHLLFRQGVKQLTPLQLASIAQAAAAMGGIGGGFDPLASVRRTLGLDRLSMGSVEGGASGSQNQTTIEAGRYVARNIYLGVKQNLSGGTQTQVQVDITRRLKAQATLSTGASAVPVQGNSLQDSGSNVGLSYQFEY